MNAPTYCPAGTSQSSAYDIFHVDGDIELSYTSVLTIKRGGERE